MCTDLRAVKQLRPLTCQLLLTVFPAGTRNSSRSWTTSGPHVIEASRRIWTYFSILLWLMCFICALLTRPPCGCSVCHLITRSSVIHPRFSRIAKRGWCHFLFQENVFGLCCFPCAVPLSSWQQITEAFVSLDGFDNTKALYKHRNNSGRVTVCRERKQQTCFHDLSSEQLLGTFF